MDEGWISTVCWRKEMSELLRQDGPSGFRRSGKMLVVIFLFVAGAGCSLITPASVPSEDSRNSRHFDRAMHRIDTDLRQGHLNDARHLVAVWRQYPGLDAGQKDLLSREKEKVDRAFALYDTGQATQLEKLGRYHEALRKIRQARVEEPGWTSLSNEEKLIRIRMTVKSSMSPDWKSMIRRLMVLKTKDPSDPDLDQTLAWAWASLSQTQYAGGKYRKALLSAKEALSFDAKNARATTVSHSISRMLEDWTREGERKFRKNDVRGSIAFFRKTLAVDPSWLRARKDLEMAREAMGADTVQNIEKK